MVRTKTRIDPDRTPGRDSGSVTRTNALAQEAPASSDLQDYAQREVDSIGLEEFAGGHAGLIVLIVVLAAALILVAIILPW